MPSGDPRIFGLPCRFPATPSIFAENRDQAFDRTQFFDMEGVPKKFLPGFFPYGRETAAHVGAVAVRHDQRAS